MNGKSTTNTTRNTQGRPVFSVVVRAFNEVDHIGRLLEGNTQQNITNLEVIIIDSGSTDETVQKAKEHSSRVPLQIIHIAPEEFTFGRSLNLGISHSRGDIIIIASAHVYPVYPDWLEMLTAPLQNLKTALSYGKQRGNHSTKYS